MRGRWFLISILTAILTLGLAGHLPASAGGGIAVLLSDEELAYRQPLPYIETALGEKLPVYNLRGDIEKAPQIMAEVMTQNPKLIIALGAKAAVVAKTWSKERPQLAVLFAMVLNWKRYDLTASNVAGIAAEASAGTQLANMVMFSPRVKRIGLIYSQEFSADFMKEATEAAGILGIEIIAREIKESREFRLTYKKLAENVDGFWLIADPLVYSLENVAWLKEQCINDRLVCIGPSANIARAGVLLAVDPDPASIGDQVASLASSILAGNREIRRIGIMQPLGTKVILNLKTAREIGLAIDNHQRDFVDTVIDY